MKKEQIINLLNEEIDRAIIKDDEKKFQRLAKLHYEIIKK